MSNIPDNAFPEESKKSNTLLMSVIAGIVLFVGTLL
ncbi:MAG: hypothetical protein RL553_1814, partial [Planctomycetota bacterium]